MIQTHMEQQDVSKNHNSSSPWDTLMSWLVLHHVSNVILDFQLVPWTWIPVTVSCCASLKMCLMISLENSTLSTPFDNTWSFGHLLSISQCLCYEHDQHNNAGRIWFVLSTDTTQVHFCLLIGSLQFTSDLPLCSITDQILLWTTFPSSHSSVSLAS